MQVKVALGLGVKTADGTHHPPAVVSRVPGMGGGVVVSQLRALLGPGVLTYLDTKNIEQTACAMV